jgi:hypothetical protein
MEEIGIGLLKILGLFGLILLVVTIGASLIGGFEETSETVIISEIGYKDSENFYINVLSADGGISYMTVAIEDTTIYREDPAKLNKNYAVINSGGYHPVEASIYITNDTEVKYIENRSVPPFEKNGKSDILTPVVTILVLPFFALLGVYIAKETL